VSICSLTPVATGTTVVFDSNPAIRFQQAVDAQLAVADLERRVRRSAADPRTAGPVVFGRSVSPLGLVAERLSPSFRSV
jgi:hypothetical protein